MIFKFQRIFYFFITLFLSITLTFFIFRLAPGDPVERILGQDVAQEEVRNYRSLLGLDQPLRIQYLNYMKGITKGDLGESLFNKKPVTTLLKERLAPTFTLATAAMILSSTFGIIFGVMAFVSFKSSNDKLIRLLSIVFLSIPVFSLAPVLVIIFSIKLNLLPVSEWGDWKHALLPILTLSLPLSSAIVRITRNKLLEEGHGPWVVVLKAKGLKQISIYLRLLKISLPTIINSLAMQFSAVLAGAMVSETIYDIPGMGTLMFEGIQNRDYPLVQGIVLYSCFISIVIYFLADLVSSKLDPRIVK